MKIKFSFPFFLLLLLEKANAQVPTVQDCLGAMPVCQNVFSTPNAFLGSGNYLNETNSGTCLSPGDKNSTWMTFTVQQSGDLNFIITPVQGGDYDWTVFNFTNAGCADIPTHPELEVSCNSSPWSVTGTNNSSTLNHQGPGTGTAFNAPIPVTTGQTYVLEIENWSGNQGGFSIDFSTSTATIFDGVPPALKSIKPIGCNPSTLTFSFSEYILCSTIQDADFTLTGPGGPYTVSGVNGTGCNAGGAMEKTFSVTVSPPITQNGTYNFNLVGASGFVTDLCGNVASAVSLPFAFKLLSVNIISNVDPTCVDANGAIAAGATGETLPYSYSLNGGALQSSATFSNLNAGIYTISVRDSNGCTAMVGDTLKNASGGVTTAISNIIPASCHGQCSGSAKVSASGGNSSYTYSWSSGGNSATVSNLCAGTYYVTVTDGIGCFDTSGVIITEPPAITGITSHTNVNCYGGHDGSASINASGGTGALKYKWMPSGGSASNAVNLTAGNYKVIVSDENNCADTLNILIQQPEQLILSKSFPDSVCKGQGTILAAYASGGTPSYTFVWNEGAFTGSSYPILPSSSSVYSCTVTDANNCSALPEDFTVKVLPLPTVDLGNDTVLCEGDALLLNAYLQNCSFLWNDGSIQSQYQANKEGVYSVDVMNNCGTAGDSINVIFNDCKTCLHFPKAFSPNGDGHNDFFRGLSDCTFSRFNLQIYSRWGKLIFETSDKTMGWDGNCNGVKCENGTYIYVADYTGIQNNIELGEAIKGNVTLLR